MASRGTLGLVGLLILAGLAAAPARVAADDVAITLYGDALDGWGFASDNITEPGPSLVVFVGDVVTLTLIGNDSALHNWFIDFDNDLSDDPEEVNSADFQGNVTVFTFTVTADMVGAYTYRCRVHPTTMTGSIEIRSGGRERSYTLYGDALDGWGPNATAITNPGPPFVLYVGDVVTLTLVGNDSTLHNWFIDFDNDLSDDPEEVNSADFQGNVTVFTFTVTADMVGAYTYRCRVHPTTMTGSIEIRSTDGGGRPGGGPLLGLVPAIIVGTVIFTLVFAVGYHVRAVRAHRRMK